MSYNLLTKNSYRSLVSLMCALCVLIFLVQENIIPSAAKYVLFSLSIIISLYFAPFALLQTNEISDKWIATTSKIIFGVTSAYLAIIILASSEQVLFIGSILIILSSIFGFGILIVDSKKHKDLFISHYLLIFFLIGLTKMIG